MRVKTILHPTDFSDSARQALKQAVRLAVAHTAKLHIYHTVLLHTEDPSRAELDVKEYVQTAKTEAQKLVGDGETLDVSFSHDRSISVLSAVMDKVGEVKPDLLVVGTHGRSGLNKFLMGSDAEKLLRHAPCNVLMLHADTPLARGGDTFRSVLVPVDFSEHSQRALEVACTLVPKASEAITLLHIVEPIPEIYYAGGVMSRFALDSDLRDRVEAKLREWAGRSVAGVMVAEGTPATEIARISSDLQAELLVMGSRGMTGLEHLLVGSVTERVCRLAGTPVLIVK